MKKLMKFSCILVCICMLFANMSIGTFASEAENTEDEGTSIVDDEKTDVEELEDEESEDENVDDEESEDENVDDEQSDDEESEDENVDDEQTDDEESEDENVDDEQTDDEESEDENVDDEQSDDEKSDDETIVEAPAAPQNVVTYAGAKAILIAWDEAEDVDGYEVFVVEDEELVSVAKTSETEYLFTVSEEQEEEQIEEQEEETCVEYVLLVCSYKGEAYSEYTEEDYIACELVDPMNMIANISHEYVDGTITFCWDVEGYLKDMTITRAEDESSVDVEEDATEVVFENANPGETWTLTFAAATADDVEVTAEYIAVVEEEEQVEHCTCDICLDWYRRNPQ